MANQNKYKKRRVEKQRFNENLAAQENTLQKQPKEVPAWKTWALAAALAVPLGIGGGVLVTALTHQPPRVTLVETEKIGGLDTFYMEPVGMGKDLEKICPEMVQKIDQKAKQIFRDLGIMPGRTAAQQLQNTNKLFEYIVDNSEYDLSTKKRSSADQLMEHAIQSAYELLIHGKAVCHGDAIALDLLLRRAGVDSKIIFIGRKDGFIDNPKNRNKAHNCHSSVAVKIADQTFILDPTIIRASIREGTIQRSDVFDENVNNRILFRPEAYVQGALPEAGIVPNADVILVHPSIEWHIQKILQANEKTLD